MNLSLRPAALRRYKDIARLILKYGRGSVVSRGAIDALAADEELAAEPATAPADDLAADLEALGPTFIKLGQVLAARADLLPAAQLAALARLQDRVAPFPFAQVESIVEEELGVRLSKVFSEFDPAPIAAASLGQVHRAALRDGRRVAVKVQRPAIRAGLAEDLEAMAAVAELLDAHTETGRRLRFAPMVEEFRRTLVRELDYRVEAENLATLGRNLEAYPRIVVPQAVSDLTTARVLTMDYVRGRKITEVSPLARLEMDGEELADQLFRAYLQQILVDGFFHADPHPGNIFLTDGRDLALLDLGMVGRLSPGLRDQLLRLVLAIGEGRGEEAAAVVEAIGVKDQDYDPAKLRQTIVAEVTAHQGLAVKDLKVGRLVLEIAHGGSEAGIRLPPELTLLGKTLVQLDEIGRALDPGFDPNAAIRRHAAELMREQVRRSFSPGNLLAKFNDFKEFVEELPGRANKILDLVARNELAVRVETIDEKLMLEGSQKIANRITLGLVLAALIVGAALLMQVPTAFRIAGYPGLAILCFAGAATGGVLLVVNILLHDRPSRRR